MNHLKVLIFAAVLFVGMVACKNEASSNKPTAESKKALADTANYTTVQWLDSIYNFGTVQKGEQVKMVFRCKNTGEKPLIITQARPGCGCTVADFTKNAIPPGGTGEVTGVFDSNRGSGMVHKSIFVVTNTKHNTEHILIFNGEIKEKS
jgi:hypothetical protein